jgi:hypothetical protein
MPFIDNSENIYTNEPGGAWWEDIVIAVIGIAVGVAISEYINWRRNNAHRAKVGKQYDINIHALEKSVEINIRALKKLIANYKEDQPYTPRFAFTKSHISVLKSIDIYVLSEFLVRNKRLKEADDLFGKMNTVDYVEHQLERMELEYNKAFDVMNSIGNDFRREAAIFGGDVISEHEKVLVNRQTDEYLKKLMLITDTYFTRPSFDDNYWANAKVAFHDILQLNGSYRNHYYFDVAEQFVRTYLIKLGTIETSMASAVEAMESVRKSLIEGYKTLSGKDWVDESATAN